MRVSVGIMVMTVLLSGAILSGCSPQASSGTLEFYANGEDFVRQGFVSKDGWSIAMDHVYVALADVTAFQTDPPYDPHSVDEIKGRVVASLEGIHVVDLADGDEDAPPVLVGEISDAAAGHYNALSWRMAQASDGPTEGYALVFVGTGEKDGRTVSFTIRIPQEYSYRCGEYVGEERKGILVEKGRADLEMTFHLDHVFGDAELPPDDGLNVAALGFEPLAQVGTGGSLDVDMAALEGKLAPADYRMLVNTLLTLGHVGEGHCHLEGR